MLNITYKLVIALMIFQCLCACTQVGAWEKGYLAKPEMAFTPDPLEKRLGDHIYFSKEASSSGSAVSGGGCGCN